MSDPAHRKLLVLDLDETLLYATKTPFDSPAAFIVTPYHVYARPHLEAFLRYCFDRFDVAVWTASSADYAAAVAGQLFGSPDRLKFLWGRDRCTLRYRHGGGEPYWVKDLKKLRRMGYVLEHIIVVDDSPRKHERNYGNLVWVKPFEGEADDDELPHLARYLETLADVENVRTVEKRGWGQRQEPRGKGQ